VFSGSHFTLAVFSGNWQKGQFHFKGKGNCLRDEKNHFQKGYSYQTPGLFSWIVWLFLNKFPGNPLCFNLVDNYTRIKKKTGAGRGNLAGSLLIPETGDLAGIY